MPITNHSSQKYQFVVDIGGGNYLVKRRSDGEHFICERYAGGRSNVQRIINSLLRTADVSGVTKLVDVITEYKTPFYGPSYGFSDDSSDSPSYGFAGSPFDVPIHTDIFLSTLPNAKSPTTVLTDHSPFEIVEYVVKQILSSMIQLSRAGVVYLPLDWENVTVDGNDYKTMMYGVTGADFGVDKSDMPPLFARFIVRLLRECKITRVPMNMLYLINSSLIADDMEELLSFVSLNLCVN